MHAAEERQHVVLAEAVELDILDDDHLRAVFVEHALAHHIGHGLRRAGGQFG